MKTNSPEKTYDILTCGDTCVDLVISGSDVTPQFGQVEKLVDDYVLEMGGSCCLFACQAAKLGLRVGIIGRVGDDDFGRLVVRRLNESGVDTQHVIVDPQIKTGAGIALAQGNDRAILTYLGSISAVTRADVHDDLLAAARHFHHGSFFLHKGLRPDIPALFQKARSLGLSISLDPNWDPDEAWDSNLLDALAYTDIFMPNEQEALLISRQATLEAAVAWLAQRGAASLTIKRGEQGARYYSTGIREEIRVQPVSGGDSVGAGDSFDAGFLAGWLRGYSIKTCLAIGAFCGRSTAAQKGGLAGQPTWTDVLANGLVEEPA